MKTYIHEDDISNIETDYLELPQFGAQYFNLEDAALLAALDEWWDDSGGGDADFDELVSNPEARKAAQPLQQKIVKALLRAASANDIKVEVLARDLGSGEPIPARTYARICDVRVLLQTYGIENGQLIELAESVDDDVYGLALSISRRRSLIKYGFMPISREVLGTTLIEQHIQLQQKFDSQSLKIAYLERRSTNSAGDARPLSTSERNTLLTIIGVLCKEAKIDHTKASKAAGLIQHTAASMGVSISETAIENHLKKIPDALGTRTK